MFNLVLPSGAAGGRKLCETVDSGSEITNLIFQKRDLTPFMWPMFQTPFGTQAIFI